MNKVSVWTAKEIPYSYEHTNLKYHHLQVYEFKWTLKLTVISWEKKSVFQSRKIWNWLYWVFHKEIEKYTLQIHTFWHLWMVISSFKCLNSVFIFILQNSLSSFWRYVILCTGKNGLEYCQLNMRKSGFLSSWRGMRHSKSAAARWF